MLTISQNGVLTLHQYEVRRHPSLRIFVNSDGLVFNYNSKNRRGWWSGCDGGLGYYRISFGHKPQKYYQVHVLVAETFLTKPDYICSVDHYPDRDKHNNKVSNLRYATPKQQSDNRYVTERCIEQYGTRRIDNPQLYYHNYYFAHREHKLEQDRKRRQLKKK